MKKRTIRREKKFYSKGDRAITLIALIVTIIVLLILAGVTIILAVNDQGIFNKAKTATGTYKNASENEQTGLDEADKEIAKYMPTNYRGYYADVNDDETVDGVIFIDLAYGASGQWYNSSGIYSYSAVTSGLRSYKTSTKVSSYSGKFGTKQVIVPNGTSGNARFYVMALSDFDTSKHTWSDACSKTQIVGSVTFRLPSKKEWSAFGGQLGITTLNYSSTYGLSNWYWSSSKSDSYYAWYADFKYGFMYNDTNTLNQYVRLCATF